MLARPCHDRDVHHERPTAGACVREEEILLKHALHSAEWQLHAEHQQAVQSEVDDEGSLIEAQHHA